MFLLNTSTTFAQSQSTEIQIIQIEQNYDAHISSMLSNHFDYESFIVNVAVDTEMVDIVTGSTRDQIIREPRGNITIPGLPFVPDEHIRPEQRMQTETVTRETTSKTLNLVNINVSILVDTSYSDQQIEFMNLLTNIAAKTDPDRGDIVDINRIPIPGYERVTTDKHPESEESNLFALFNRYIPGLLLFLFILLFVGNRFHSSSKND